ncbi:MAG: CoA-binding protein [Burkholderiales bacterium]|nr:CoA-binding protein [Burkholderiales bacterium]
MRSLDAILDPRAIAAIGASHEERRPGGPPLHALTTYGYAGALYAVNPRYSETRGIPCYPNVSALSRTPDLAIVALPAADVPRVVEECAACGIRHAVVLSAGFRELGTAGAELQAALSHTANLTDDYDFYRATLSRLSWLIADHADDIAEIEINPLVVGEAGAGAIAVDALIRTRTQAGAP